jgi:hypothetical protein
MLELLQLPLMQALPLQPNPGPLPIAHSSASIWPTIFLVAGALTIAGLVAWYAVASWRRGRPEREARATLTRLRRVVDSAPEMAVIQGVATLRNYLALRFHLATRQRSRQEWFPLLNDILVNDEQRRAWAELLERTEPIEFAGISITSVDSGLILQQIARCLDDLVLVSRVRREGAKASPTDRPRGE